MPKVSIIIPVYNTEKYLRKCLDSVCNQTLSDIEIICINDCSSDNSLEILREYSKKDERIKLIDFKENKGVSIARNTGIEEASGEYIGFVDSDDFVDLDFYEKLYNKAFKTYADCAKGNIYDYNLKTGESTLTAFYDQNENIFKNKAYFCYGFTSAIYKTKLIKNNNISFPEGITYFEDPYFSILISILAHKVEIINNAKYNYLRHNNSACFNCKNLKQVKALSNSICLIMDSINKFDLPSSTYNIYSSFLMEQIIPWCSDLELDNKSNLEAIKALAYIFNNSKFSASDLFTYYFLHEKEVKKARLKHDKTVLIKQLRERLKNNKA